MHVVIADLDTLEKKDSFIDSFPTAESSKLRSFMHTEDFLEMLSCLQHGLEEYTSKCRTSFTYILSETCCKDDIWAFLSSKGYKVHGKTSDENALIIDWA